MVAGLSLARRKFQDRLTNIRASQHTGPMQAAPQTLTANISALMLAICGHLFMATEQSWRGLWRQT
jgi:hypothetical protein